MKAQGVQRIIFLVVIVKEAIEMVLHGFGY
jgi:hypothetical protein